MRVLALIWFSFIVVGSSAQYYITDIVPPSSPFPKVDLLKIKADSLYAAGLYQDAADTYFKLHEQWEEIMEAATPSDQYFQNSIFGEVYYLKTRFKIRDRKASYEAMAKLEAPLIARLGEGHVIFGMYYHELGIMLFQYKADYEKGYEVTTKALEIREEKLPEYKKDIAWSSNTLGLFARDMFSVDSALHYQYKALEVRQSIEPPDSTMLLVSYVNISQNHMLNGDYHLEKEALLNAKKSGEVLPPEHAYNLMVNTNLAKVYYRNAAFQKALRVSKETLEHRKKIFKGEAAIHLADNYHSIANTYTNLGYVDSAAIYLDTLLSIRTKSGEKRGITHTLTALARSKVNPDQTIKIFKQAIDLCDEDVSCTDKMLGDMYAHIAEKCMHKRDPHKAISYALKAKEIYDDVGDINKNGNYAFLSITIAEILKALSREDEAISNLESSLDIFENDTIVSPLWLLGAQMELARLYTRAKNFSSAKMMFDKIFNSMDKLPNVSYELKTIAYGYLSVYHLKEQDYAEAIDAALESKKFCEEQPDDFIKAVANLNLLNSYKESGMQCEAHAELRETSKLLGLQGWLDSDYSKPNILPARLKGTIDYAIRLYRGSDDIFYNNTHQQLQLITSIVEMIDDCRNAYFYKDSEQDLYELESSFYDLVLTQMYQQSLESDNSELVEMAFFIMEKSRSIGIARVNNQQHYLDNNKVPQSVISEEKRINYKSEKIFEDFDNRIIGQDSLNFFRAELEQLEKEKNAFLNLLQTKYPDYYADRYKHDVISLEKAKQIASRQDVGFLCYYNTGKELFSLVVTADDVQFLTHDLTVLEEEIMDLKSFLSKAHKSGDEITYDQEKLSYTERAYQVCDKLLGHKILNVLPKELVIIPDGILLNLPFEVLLSEKVTTDTSYKSLPYLMQDKVISYNGSLTLYEKGSLNLEKQSYKGFAPVYSSDNSENDEDQKRSTLSLTRNVDEIERCADLFNGTQYVGEQANKKRLYSYEIAEMNIDADLVVLSSCETNVGDNIEGEGIRGIARSFYLAACPNLLLTNWLVDDQSSNHIVYDFLGGIKQGISPSMALRNSKMNFIESSTNVHAHPSYWAPFTYYGSQHAAAVSPRIRISGIQFAGTLAFLLLILYWFKNKL